MCVSIPKFDENYLKTRQTFYHQSNGPSKFIRNQALQAVKKRSTPSTRQSKSTPRKKNILAAANIPPLH